jgi:hypothetical protein
VSLQRSPSGSSLPLTFPEGVVVDDLDPAVRVEVLDAVPFDHDISVVADDRGGSGGPRTCLWS